MDIYINIVVYGLVFVMIVRARAVAKKVPPPYLIHWWRKKVVYHGFERLPFSRKEAFKEPPTWLGPAPIPGSCRVELLHPCQALFFTEEIRERLQHFKSFKIGHEALTFVCLRRDKHRQETDANEVVNHLLGAVPGAFPKENLADPDVHFRLWNHLWYLHFEADEATRNQALSFSLDVPPSPEDQGHAATLQRALLGGDADTDLVVDYLVVVEAKKVLRDYLLVPDPRPAAVAKIFAALGLWRDILSLDKIIEVMNRHEEEAVLRQGLIALGKMGTRRVVPQILKYLGDGTGPLAPTAASALAVSGDLALVPELLAIAGNSSKETAQALTKSIEAIQSMRGGEQGALSLTAPGEDGGLSLTTESEDGGLSLTATASK